MKVYTAYPNPYGHNAQVGSVYNEDGEVFWDCRCGARGLLAGGLHNHECYATLRQDAAHKIQEKISRMGEPTEHPNIREIPREEVPKAFLDWLVRTGEAELKEQPPVQSASGQSKS